MGDANVTKELVKFDILASPISLDMHNFLIQKAFNMALELKKNIKDIILSFKEIQPCKTTITIDETDIKSVSTSRRLGRTPNIRIYYLKGRRNHTTRKGKR
jgi:hypothetical protein